LKAIHNDKEYFVTGFLIVSDANLHKFWKQFTTHPNFVRRAMGLFPMQIYTNFESNSQHL